jgi:thiol:disulfide interchange protein DsbD
VIPWIPEQDAQRSHATPGRLLNLPDQRGAGKPLPPDQAFVVDAIARSPTELLLRWTMPRGYYIYRDHTALSLEDSGGATLGAPRWPPGVLHADPYFGEKVVYFDEIDLPVPLLRNAAGDARQVMLRVTFQGCQNGGICYPPLVRTIKVDVSAASASQLTALEKAATSVSSVIAPPVSTSATPRVAAAPPAATNAPVQATASPISTGLAFALLLAFAGGLILNLMPCVLPVLAIKAVGVLESGESRGRARAGALAYAAGVISTFLAIGLVILGLRSVGHAVGWGTQLQQPWLVAVLACVLFVVGLSMSGVVQFGSRLANIGSGLSGRGGAAGHFFTGVLAVVVASPCTAPFMGVALAYAFVAPGAHELLVMLVLGIGLALPLTLIGLVPALAKLLPKPGRWMETLKQILAFPMYLSAIWLVWVLAHQRGADAVALVLVAMVLLAAAFWWAGRGGPARRLGHVFTLVLALAGLASLYAVARIAPPLHGAVADGGSVVFSPTKLQSLRAAGTPVFVDIGADWCVTCKANEYAVLDTQGFHDLLAKTGAVYMKGDWTDVDPEIGAYLKSFHSPGVPLYVVYPRGGGAGHALPTVLTASLVRSALETASK